MSRRESHTTLIERNRTWEGAFETEPYETAWAAEAIFFIRALAAVGLSGPLAARVQISPDGMHWCDEGATAPLPTADQPLTFGRVSHFGGWLRLAGELPPGASMKVIVYLVLKS